MDIQDLFKWILGICVAGITIYKFFWKAPSEKEIKQAEVIPETIATRLVALFESHGVHRNQIPEFFGHGLEISSCASDEKLIEKITPEIINDAVVLFGVNKDWLEGSSKEIYDIPDFYKHPERFKHYLVELLKSKSADRFSSYVLTSNEKLVGAHYDALFVIAEPIGEINQREIYKYHLLGRWVIKYWKNRAYFAACCALLHKHELFAGGKIVENSWLNRVYEGKQLLEYDFTERQGGVSFPIVGSWMVDEFIEIPDKFLDGMDTEQGRATPLAIGKWLDLSDKGYMRCFPEDKAFHAGVEDQFRKKLKTLDFPDCQVGPGMSTKNNT
ncbi:MAG: hypothetical protein ACJAXJ_004083 [Colwellia sp.]|jgi:hypothetical protein